MDALIKWAIYGLIAAACVATVTLAWDHYVIAPAEARGAAQQEAKDAPVIGHLKAQLIEAQQALATAQAEADATAAKYQAQQAAAQAAAQQAKEANDARIASLTQQVAKLSDDKRIVLSAYARLVFDSASRAANSGGAATAAGAGDHATPSAVPATAVGVSERELADYAVRGAAAYADAWTGWNACINAYNSLRSSQ